MIFDRLGVITDEVSSHFIEALNWVKDQQLNHVEVRTVDGNNITTLTDEELEYVVKEVEKRGLFISCISSPLFKCALDPSRSVATGDQFGQEEETVEKHFLKLNRTIEIARFLNTDKIRVFSFWREANPNDYEEEIVFHLKKAAGIAEKENVVLLLENEPSCNGGFASEVAQLVKKVDSSHLKALWDPGNEEYGGKSAFPEGYEAIKDFIGHIHLKDAYVDQDGEPHCVPIGSGNVSYDDQFLALQKLGYQGLFTIETHYTPVNGTKMTGTELTIEGLKKIAAN